MEILEPIRSSALTRLQLRLLSIHPGAAFQPDEYLLQWCTPAVAELLELHAVELHPERIVYRPGVPLDCHGEALRYATQYPTATAWSGFAYYSQENMWWVHSFVMNGDTLIDSAQPSEPAHFVGIKWGIELYEALLGKPVSNPEDLPPVLRRSLFSVR